MTRQPWWPPLVVNRYEEPWLTRKVEEAYTAMDTAWRERIETLYEGPYPDPGFDPQGLLDWFVAKLSKEENDA